MFYNKKVLTLYFLCPHRWLACTAPSSTRSGWTTTFATPSRGTGSSTLWSTTPGCPGGPSWGSAAGPPWSSLDPGVRSLKSLSVRAKCPVSGGFCERRSSTSRLTLKTRGQRCPWRVRHKPALGTGSSIPGRLFMWRERRKQTAGCLWRTAPTTGLWRSIPRRDSFWKQLARPGNGVPKTGPSPKPASTRPKWDKNLDRICFLYKKNILI